MMKIQVLGTAQDGGIPHIGCTCVNCDAARRDLSKRRLVVCLGIWDEENNAGYIVDATPDISEQSFRFHSKFFQAKGIFDIEGVILTHAHMGHYIGLAHLGREAASTRKLPVYATEQMQDFITSNLPFSYLVKRKQIKLRDITKLEEKTRSKGGSINCFTVPHRNEDTDTVGIRVTGDSKTLVYIPDIDTYNEEVVEIVSSADIALIDGSFFSTDELPSRIMKVIAHEPIEMVMKLFSESDTKIYFTHFNHTNPVLDPESIERQKILDAGFHVLEDDEEFTV